MIFAILQTPPAKLGIKVLRIWGAWCFWCPRDCYIICRRRWFSHILPLSFVAFLALEIVLVVETTFFFVTREGWGEGFVKIFEIMKPVWTKPMADFQKLLMWRHMTRVCVCSPHLPLKICTHVHKWTMRLRCWRCFPPRQLGKLWFQDGHLIKIRSGRYSPVASYSNKRFYFWNVDVTKKWTVIYAQMKTSQSKLCHKSIENHCIYTLVIFS